MRGALEKFGDLDAQILVIDPHERYRVRHMLKGIEKEEPGVAVLADPVHAVSAAYGVAFQMRIHTEWANRPATFVVDREGVIRFAHRGRKYNDRPSTEKVIEVLKSLRTKPVGE